MGDLIPFPRRTSEPYLRQAEAASYLGVTVRTLRAWHHKGVPVHRVGAVCLYRASELDAWVELQGRLRTPKG